MMETITAELIHSYLESHHFKPTEKLWYSESSKLVPHWVIMLTDEEIKTPQGKYRYRILKGSIIPSDTVTRKSDTIDRRNEIIRLIKNGILVSIKIDEKLFYRFEHDSDCTYSTGKARKIASLGTDGRFGFSRFETDNCSDTFDLISECTGILQLSDAEIITPHYVVKNIIGQLPSSVFNPKTRFLDPSVKSGRFLVEVYSALFRAPEMIKYFPDEGARKRYILHNQLFGLATSPAAATIARKTVYDDPTILGNIRYIEGYTPSKDRKYIESLINREFGVDTVDIIINSI